jgi:hypothetical protein
VSSKNEAVGYSSDRECVLNEGIALRVDETNVSILDALGTAGRSVRQPTRVLARQIARLVRVVSGQV